MSTSSSSSSLWIDLIAGGIAGSVGIIVGHPFDTIKVRLQTQTQTPTAGTACNSNSTTTTTTASRQLPSQLNNVIQPRTSSPSLSRSIYHTLLVRLPQSIQSLYRGIGPPLASAGIVNATIFLSYQAASKWFEEDYNNNNNVYYNNKNSHIQPIICGAFAGFTSSLLLTPIELIKCRRQQQQQQPYHRQISNISLRPPQPQPQQLVVTPTLLLQNVRNMYRGFTATCLRQIPAFAIYFTTYQYILDQTTTPSSSTTISYPINSLIAGGIAGSLSWAVVYPMDVIKSRIQCSSPTFSSCHLYSSSPTILQTIRTMMLTSPAAVSSTSSILFSSSSLSPIIRPFYRGLGITIVRAFPVNATIFFVYEYVREQLQSIIINNNNEFNSIFTMIVHLNKHHSSSSPVGDNNSRHSRPSIMQRQTTSTSS